MASIFVSGFDYATDEAVLKKHFASVGEIKELHFQSRGGAVVTYVKASAATRAVNELHETTMQGQTRYVAVKLDERDAGKGKSKGDRSGKGKGGKGGGDASGRTIFVRGFDFGTDDDALTWHFGKMGAIEDYHFQSMGSAVITYVKEAAAQKALAKLDGTTMQGQSRYVSIKLDDPDRDGGGKGKSGKGSGKGAKGSGKSGKSSGKDSSNGRGIYISGFDFDTDEAAVEKHFGGMGTIENCYFQSRGAAVVTFSDEAAAQRAVTELHESTMEGQSRYVAVKLDNVAHRKGGGKGKGK